jgi:hypothetical protein
MPVADRVATEHVLQPVRAAGRARPIGVTVTIGVILATLIWQPWGRTNRPVAPPTPAAVVADHASPALSSPSHEASPSALSLRGPRPRFGPIASGPPGSPAYISLVDNEWTVVALLTPEAMATADQPWVADGAGVVLQPAGALLVLQLGPNVTHTPIDRSSHPDAACRAPDGFRDPPAAHYPARRVAYLGVTYPGMDPRARVTGVMLDRPRSVLKRLPVVSVALSGMIDGQRYTVPTSGTGGAALFALSPPAIMPVGSYRFDIQIPGISGHHYMYACIGS